MTGICCFVEHQNENFCNLRLKNSAVYKPHLSPHLAVFFIIQQAALKNTNQIERTNFRHTIWFAIWILWTLKLKGKKNTNYSKICRLFIGIIFAENIQGIFFKQ